MKPTIAKIIMRAVGTLAGLLGLGMFWVTPFLLYYFITKRNVWMILFTGLPLGLSVYLIYIAYLVWFRFSPLAVRHICGALGFYALALIAKLVEPSPDLDKPWLAFASLGCLVAVYIAYRVASNRLNRLLFPEGVSGVES